MHQLFHPRAPATEQQTEIGRNLIANRAYYTYALSYQHRVKLHARPITGRVRVKYIQLLINPFGGSSAEVTPLAGSALQATQFGSMLFTASHFSRTEVGGRLTNLAYPCIL